MLFTLIFLSAKSLAYAIVSCFKPPLDAVKDGLFGKPVYCAMLLIFIIDPPSVLKLFFNPSISKKDAFRFMAIVLSKFFIVVSEFSETFGIVIPAAFIPSIDFLANLSFIIN